MPRKYFLDVVTEQFLAQEFFSLHQEMFSYCKKKVLCQEKKFLGREKKKILRPRKKKDFCKKKSYFSTPRKHFLRIKYFPSMKAMNATMATSCPISVPSPTLKRGLSYLSLSQARVSKP